MGRCQWALDQKQSEMRARLRPHTGVTGFGFPRTAGCERGDPRTLLGLDGRGSASGTAVRRWVKFDLIWSTALLVVGGVALALAV